MDKINKSELSEIDICDLFITPAIKDSGWDPMQQIRREVTLTPGPIIVRGNMSSRNRKKKKFADYVLYREPGVPIAVVEAKDNHHTVGHGIRQALGYAEILEVPSAFSSNGDAFASHNMVPAAGEEIETQFPLEKFPPPQILWKRCKSYRGIEEESEELVLQPYHTDSSGKEPRYYQVEAINRVVEAVAGGQKRVLIVMATGTGKTYTTFQIIWRLWKARVVKRTLFLVDRNILADQTLVNDFKPFGSVMTKIKNRKIDPAYEIHLGLYQAITGPDEADKIFKNVSPDFFDMIVIDECHRGSAAEDSAWREILDYFSGAIQIGMTATPKETKYVSNITYFGEKEQLLWECNLHTIVRLPNGVFNPYTGIKTNLLFFTKGQPTEHIWYYEHPYPKGAKSYNKTKPMRFEEFQTEIDWWGREEDGFAVRVETEQAWKVSIDDIKTRNYNLDIKNPHVAEQINHDPDELLEKYARQQQEISGLRDRLKTILAEALNNGGAA